ncbi:MAG: hypothetical protein J6X18_01305 [Bacteroidales bacterium]|nr:hypothetical protein [Bacteroidales bacterium]
MFRRFDGKKIESASEYVKDYMKTHPGIDILIGTDSQIRGRFTVYATIIAMYTPGKGAHCIYEKWKEKSRVVRQVRLMNEVCASIACAEKLVSEGVNKPKYIDIDINKNPKYKSSEVFASANGMVEGMGYKVRSKGDGPLVTSIADYVVKH